MSEPRHSATFATDQQQIIDATAATAIQGRHALCTASDDASNQLSAAPDATNLLLPDPRVLGDSSSSARVTVEGSTPSLAPQNVTKPPRLSTPTFPTPNADQLFNWSFPATVLVPPSGPEDTRASGIRSLGRGTKQQTAITRKRRHDLTTPHFGLVESRINPPSFFAMHLRQTQILINVRQAPDLPFAFSAVVDKYLEARGSDLPNVNPDILPLLDTYCDSPAKIEDENGIGNVCAVSEDIAVYIASTLYTKSPVWAHALKWARKATHGITHAVAGAYLSIADSCHFIRDSPPGSSNIWEGLYSVRRRQPSPGPFMVWKFVPAGDPFGEEGDEYYADDGKLMDIISKIAKGDLGFKWASCGHFTAPHASCNSKKHQNVFLQVTQTGHEMTEDAPGTLAMLERYSTQDTDVTRVRSSVCNSPHSLVRRAGFILQDWYSEMVAIDATYGVLFTGNKKILGVRGRDTQSMHLSKVIDVQQDTSCLKVQAGMMLAALEDIDERSSIFRDQRRRGDLPKQFDKFFDIDSTYFPEAIPRTRHPKDAAPEIPVPFRCHTHELGAFLRRQKEITLRWPTGISLLIGLDQPYIIPRRYFLHGPVDDEAPVNFDNAEIMIRTPFDRNTFLANLWQPDESRHVGNYFVAKLANGYNDTEKLREEAAWYEYLRHTNHTGIPQCFGYWESPPEPSGISDFGVLLLEMCDRSLAAQKSIGRGMQNAISEWLNGLHDSGIVHTRLSQKTILFDGDNYGLHFRVVGWGNAEFIVDDEGYEGPNAEYKREQDLKDLAAAFNSMRKVLEVEKKEARRFDNTFTPKRVKSST